jgi:outer membrane lipoprotein-sorting protein
MQFKMKKNIFVFSVLLFVSLASIAIPADTSFNALSDTNAFLSKLKNYSASLSSLECNFTQCKYSEIFTEPDISEGYFCYKKPELVRWEYQKPDKYVVLISNNQVSIFEKNTVKNINMDAHKGLFSMVNQLGKVIQGDVFNYKNEFQFSYFENTTTYKVVLIPRIKSLKKYFVQLILLFDKKQFSVAQITMVEKKSEYTQISFHNRKINEPLKDELFKIPQK